MKIKLLQKLFLVISLSLIPASLTWGQTINDAIDAYNQGIGLIDSDIKAAIASLEKSHQIANGLGAEGEEIKEQAEVQIPGLYYNMALGYHREKKIEQAVEVLKKTIEISDKYDDQNTKRRSENVLHQLYAMQANAAFRENENDEAIKLFDMALDINPQHTQSHLGKGLVYRRLEDAEKFKEAMDLAIKTGLVTEQEKIVQTAASTARDFFLVRAVKAKGEQNYDQAIQLLSTSLTYDESFPETHFLLATIHNEQSRFQDAIKSAQRALDLLNNNKDESAKIYFELGKSYSGLGNTSQACTAFKEAARGNYEESAKYQMEHVLKCQ